MKKLNLLVVFIFALFVFLPNAFATRISWANDFKCAKDVTLDDGTVSRTCQVGFTVSGGVDDNNIAILKLTMANFYVHSITPKDGWAISEIDKDKTYTLEYNKPNFESNTYVIAEIVFYKINPTLTDPKDCYIQYDFEFNKIDRTCTYDAKTKTYYGLNELPTTELQYQKDCEENVCKMLSDGTYYGKDGKTTDKETFNRDCLDLVCVMEVKTCDGEDDCTIHASYGYVLKEGESVSKYYNNKGSEVSKEDFDYECGKHYCEKLNVPNRTCEVGSPNCYDGGKTVYYDKSGRETSLEKYTLECFEYQCKVVYNTYFGKNGLQVSKLNYQKECETHICEKLSDGTLFGKNGTIVDNVTYRKECEKIVCERLSDGTYYGKEGTEVNAEQYLRECGKVFCEKFSDGTYYGKNGTTVDELTYQKECEKIVCEKLGDGTYYDKNGKMVDELIYQKECGKFTCTKLSNGTYYGKDGNIVNELTYNIDCLPHKCEKVGDQYFNDKGDKVSEEEYNKYCGPLSESPQTGMKISLVVLTIMAILMTTSFIIIKKKDKFVKKLS